MLLGSFLTWGGGAESVLTKIHGKRHGVVSSCETYMLPEPQSRRVRFQADVFQRDLLDQFVSLCDSIKEKVWNNVDMKSILIFIHFRQ